MIFQMSEEASFSVENQVLGQSQTIRLTVNGREIAEPVAPRLLLSDFLRDQLGLTGTHVGCEHGACGACTVLAEGEPVCSCLMFAIQTEGMRITTVEGLACGQELHPVQKAFQEAHGLQCGFCTPGILLTVVPFLKGNRNPSEPEIRDLLGGNLCRCTGYQNIIRAVLLAAQKCTDPKPVSPGEET